MYKNKKNIVINKETNSRFLCDIIFLFALFIFWSLSSYLCLPDIIWGISTWVTYKEYWPKLYLIQEGRLFFFHCSCSGISRPVLIFTKAQLLLSRFDWVQVNTARFRDGTHIYYVTKWTNPSFKQLSFFFLNIRLIIKHIKAIKHLIWSSLII